MQYKLLKALPNRFEDELNKANEQGYKLVGDPFTLPSSNYILILLSITVPALRRLNED